ncbi:hypothetical protein QTP88_019628 [Uroleucon formosanum]
MQNLMLLVHHHVMICNQIIQIPQRVCSAEKKTPIRAQSVENTSVVTSTPTSPSSYHTNAPTAQGNVNNSDSAFNCVSTTPSSLSSKTSPVQGDSNTALSSLKTIAQKAIDQAGIDISQQSTDNRRAVQGEKETPLQTYYRLKLETEELVQEKYFAGYSLLTAQMHFRRCVALVVREYAAHRYKLPVTEINQHHIESYINALDGYTEFVRCIYYALCGVEPPTQISEKTVLWWLINKKTIIDVLYNPNNCRHKNIKGDFSEYPMYNIQNVWVIPLERITFNPSEETMRGIEAVLEEFQHPRFPNFNLPKPTKVKKDRKISIINEDDNVNFDKDVWKTPTNVRIIKESTYVNIFLSAA